MMVEGGAEYTGTGFVELSKTFATKDAIFFGYYHIDREYRIGVNVINQPLSLPSRMARQRSLQNWIVLILRRNRTEIGICECPCFLPIFAALWLGVEKIQTPQNLWVVSSSRKW